MKLKSTIFILLLMLAGLQTAWAQGFRVYKSDGTVAQFSLRTDSIVFYEDSIREYSKEASYIPNVIGIIIGIPLTIAGSVIFFAGLSVVQANSILAVLAVAAITFVAAPVLLIGVPLLIHNYNNYQVHKKNADKRDEYKEALERYKQKQHSVEVAITPVTNLAGSSIGINAILSF